MFHILFLHFKSHLIHPQEVEDEWAMGLRPKVIPILKQRYALTSNMNKALLGREPSTTRYQDLNFCDGFAGHFVDTIVKNNDLHVSRNRIANNMKRGQKNTSMLHGIKKKITAGKLAHVGEY